MNGSLLRISLVLCVLSAIALALFRPQAASAASNPIAHTATTTLVDELGDWSKVNGQSGGWSFDSTNPASFENDTTRIKRNSNTNQSISYYRVDGITNLTAKIYYYSSIAGKVRFFRSTDAATWTLVTTTNTTGVATSGGWYRTTFSPAAALPSGVKYMMIEVYNDANIWAPQVAQVSLTYNTAAAPTATAVVNPTATQVLTGGFTDNLDSFNTGLFSKSDGWTNGSMFNAGWRADHVTFSGGLMTITVNNTPCPSGCSNMPYAAGEYRSNSLYSHGRFETRMKPAKYSGAMTGSLFTYTGPSDGNPWDEIDVEFLGKNLNVMQTNYFTNGVGGHETVVNLGFDASAGFHTYAFEWTSGSIKWYVDGALVVTENGSRGALPTHAARIMLNAWPATGVDGWLGTFTYTGPFQAQYDWVKYTPLP